MEKFSFDGAIMHFARTKAEGSFALRFLLAYLALYALAAIALWFLIGPAFLNLINTEPTELERMSESEAWALFGRIGLGYLIVLPLIIAVWAMLEASIQRRYMRLEGFSIRFGSDELRMVAVGFLWLAVFIGLYLLLAILLFVVMLPFGLGGGGQPSPALFLVPFLLILFMFVPVIFIMVRLSPAAALTIRDRSVRFSSAWGVTRGRFWPLFGAFVIIFVVSGIASSMVQNAGMMYFAGQLASSGAFESVDDPSEMFAVLASPLVWVPGLIFLLIYLALQAATQFIIAGVPAHAARTDPNWAASPMAAEAFD